MAEFVRFVLDDGSEVFFESAEGDLVALHGGEADVADGGPLSARLGSVAEAASQVAGSLRTRLAPDEVALEFGLRCPARSTGGFSLKNQAEGTIKVTLNWRQHDNGRPAQH